MKLLEIYKKKNQDKKWLDDHSTLSNGTAGRMFEYTNTNFRTQNSFITQFQKFLQIEDKDREHWLKQEHHGQELDKHRVINMVQSKLFKKDKNGLYSRTDKGMCYSDFISSDIPQENKWIINYLFLLNGYFSNRKNYIIYRVKDDLLGFLLSVDGITEDLIIKYAKDLLDTDSLEAALRSDFFFLHSFYNDSDFLIGYFRASKLEKEELADYIQENIKTGNFACCISKKYQAGGNFNHNMLLDETRVFLMTLLFIKSQDVHLNNIYKFFVESFNQNIYLVSKELVLPYLYSNKNIFDPIFKEILELEELNVSFSDSIDVLETNKILKLDSNDKPEDYIDETSEDGKQKIKAVYNLRKRQARIQNNYKCALESINNCRPVYFTAKSNNQNYIEVHHFIPREFRNDFSYSIEVLANYITLCPRCHKQIHLAVDRERKHLINALYEDRKNRLELVGLSLSLEGIYEYYRID